MQSNVVNEVTELPPARAVGFGVVVRLRGAIIAAGCVAVVALAASLTPRRAGYGTHENLGLPGCEFLQRTGYPCPSCGMTTSFANLARGRVGAAWAAQPFGIVLFAGVLVLGAAGLGELVWGRDYRPENAQTFA